MAVRVLRLMEYTYDSLESAHRDMGQWKVQGTWSPSARVTIRSTTILNPTPVEEPVTVTEYFPATIVEKHI